MLRGLDVFVEKAGKFGTPRKNFLGQWAASYVSIVGIFLWAIGKTERRVPGQPDQSGKK